MLKAVVSQEPMRNFPIIAPIKIVVKFQKSPMGPGIKNDCVGKNRLS
jgi:hypothetical protein